MAFLHSHRFRVLANAACFTYWAALLLSWSHFATTVHAYCTEHGEIIHVDRAVLAHLAARETPADPHTTALGSPEYLRGAHGCLALDFLVQPKLDGRVTVLAACSDAAAFEAPVPGALQRRPIGVLRLSPKTSPPAGQLIENINS